MLIKKPADVLYSEITPKHIYMNRRKFLAAVPAAFLGARELLSPSARAFAGTKLPNVQKSKYTVDEKQNSYQEVSTYNNFYEFGTDKSEPAEYAKNFKTSPWTVSVEGACAKPRKFTHRGDSGAGSAGRACVPASLRGSLVDCGAVDWIFVERTAQQGGADIQGELRCV